MTTDLKPPPVSDASTAPVETSGDNPAVPALEDLPPAGFFLVRAYREESREFLSRGERDQFEAAFRTFVGSRNRNHKVDVEIPVPLFWIRMFLLFQAGFDRRRNRVADAEIMTTRIWSEEMLEALTERKRRRLVNMVDRFFVRRRRRAGLDFRLKIPFPRKSIYMRILFARDRRNRHERVANDRRKKARFAFDFMGGTVICIWLAIMALTVLGLIIYIFKTAAGVDFLPDMHLRDVLPF